MDEQQNLGKIGPWQIKEFPETLREDITRQAKAERMSVGEFVTAHLVAIRDAGWPRAGQSVEAIGKRFANGSTTSIADLRNTVEMACMIAEHKENMPKGVAQMANSLVKGQFAAMKKSAKALLPPPAVVADVSVNALQTAAAEKPKSPARAVISKQSANR